MHVNALQVIGAIVLGGAASALGGYLSGVRLGSKWIGREFAGYMGFLYGPVAGLGGVIVGVIVVSALAAGKS